MVIVTNLMNERLIKMPRLNALLHQTLLKNNVIWFQSGCKSEIYSKLFRGQKKLSTYSFRDFSGCNSITSIGLTNHFEMLSIYMSCYLFSYFLVCQKPLARTKKFSGPRFYPVSKFLTIPHSTHILQLPQWHHTVKFIASLYPALVILILTILRKPAYRSTWDSHAPRPGEGKNKTPSKPWGKFQ